VAEAQTTLNIQKQRLRAERAEAKAAQDAKHGAQLTLRGAKETERASRRQARAESMRPETPESRVVRVPTVRAQPAPTVVHFRQLPADIEIEDAPSASPGVNTVAGAVRQNRLVGGNPALLNDPNFVKAFSSGRPSTRSRG
jgi:hypothetical protein